jgi:homopolymeric O-antigen transport system ATP-binding protein
MSENAIVVENLSKRYLIGHRLSAGGQYKYTSLRDVIGREIINFVRKAGDVVRGRQVVQGDEIEEFWALRDVNFELKQGEVLGIIGRNGAGKSTLLKILSRITEPTQGRVLFRGRISSLLEVGTGFHPELTGRENIFLNGAILGMTQREIRRKFDEIVAFAEVEKFLDTPVKHYSSGMYVRLAFAVAAHLEPEILIIDEVLAVGDAEFQKKCLGKMDDVSRRQGRTVLFVSHNMEAILRLCSRGIFLESGLVRAIGDIKTVVSPYLYSQSRSPRVVDLSNKAGLRRSHPGPLASLRTDFTRKPRLAKITPSSSKGSWSIPFGKPIAVDISIDAQSSVSRVEIALDVKAGGTQVVTWTNKCSEVELPVHPGINTFRIEFQHMRLCPGQYFLGVNLGCDQGFYDYIPEAVQFEIIPNFEAAEINADNFGGVVVPFAKVSVID